MGRRGDEPTKAEVNLISSHIARERFSELLSGKGEIGSLWEAVRCSAKDKEDLSKYSMLGGGGGGWLGSPVTFYAQTSVQELMGGYLPRGLWSLGRETSDGEDSGITRKG